MSITHHPKALAYARQQGVTLIEGQQVPTTGTVNELYTALKNVGCRVTTKMRKGELEKIALTFNIEHRFAVDTDRLTKRQQRRLRRIGVCF